ncbi:MAG: enoyl-CoA hydratase/isomerase family protein [Chloroflexi bacterium]|nr:enoyl-CoA hydratase/isomerase family protein [Chloroflexota bacterium]
MDYQTLIYAVDGGIATITLNRPEKLNAINDVMDREILLALRQAAEDDGVRVVVITGAGRGFCSGEDVTGSRQVGERSAQGASPRMAAAPPQNLAEVMRGMAQPTIAAINGPAVGQGFSLAIACDIRIASERARLGAIWVLRGAPPESGAAYNLVRLVGMGKACELTFTGRILDAQEAFQIGLVNRVVPHDSLMETTNELARTIAAGPPIAMALAKRSLYLAQETTMANFLQYEAWALNYSFRTQDREEAVRAFLERRSPSYQGR